MDQVLQVLQVERVKLLDQVFERLSLEFKDCSAAAKIIGDMKAMPAVAQTAASHGVPSVTSPDSACSSGALTPVKAVNKDGRPASGYHVFQRVVKKMFGTLSFKDVKATKTGAWVREDHELFDRVNRPIHQSFPGCVGGEEFEDALMTKYVLYMVAKHSA